MRKYYTVDSSRVRTVADEESMLLRVVPSCVSLKTRNEKKGEERRGERAESTNHSVQHARRGARTTSG